MNAEKYFASWILAKCFARASLDEGEKAYCLRQFGLDISDVESINLNMIQLKQMPGYVTPAKATDLLREVIAEEA